MIKTFKKVGTPVGLVFLLLMTVTSIASAADFGPRRRPGHRARYSVAEPAAIALLGAGLISLGFYAKKKRGKKQ